MLAMRRFSPIAVVVALVVAITAIPAFAKTRNVAVKDDVFAPTSITVKKGTSVKWVWKGKHPHNVTVTTGPQQFHSSTKQKGAYTHRFSKKGTYKILCTVHAPNMKMTVKVT
jgi:plastocyanin